jgi:hypothetical protein
MAVLRGNEARYFLARLRQSSRARTDPGRAPGADTTPVQRPASHDCDAGTPAESPAAGPE